MKNIHAFTLVELLVTLAVFSILALAAIPAFNGYVINNRIVTDTNNFVGALNLARNEAMKRRADISICRSTDGVTCATTTGTWNQGWLVFANTNNDSPAQVDTGEEIIHLYSALSNSITSSASVADYITFNSSGYSNAQGQFIMCDKNASTDTSRSISINRIGRIILTTGVGTCTAS